MRIYKLTYEEVERYASHVILSDIQRTIWNEVLPDFDNWDVTVTRYYDSEPWPNDFQYEIKFYNKLAEDYNEDLHNCFSENYFRQNIYNLCRVYILTRAQINDYIEHLGVTQPLIDKLRSYYNDDSYRWELTFDPNDSMYDWALKVLYAGSCVYSDRITLNGGLEILNGHGSSTLWEPHLANPVPTPDVKEAVGAPRSCEGVWYLSKRQLRNYYDNMSSYSRKVETAIRDYDNYCVRIEKADDVYTLIIDRMQPDIVRNFYSATIDRHTFNTILGIQSNEDTDSCDSEIEEINVDGEIEDEDSVRDNDLCEECGSDEEVEVRPMSEDPDLLFVMVDGQLRRLLLRNEFARFKTTLFYSNYKVDEIYDNYDNFSVYIIKDGNNHYSLIADRVDLSCPAYFKDGFDSDNCLAHYFGQDFVNKFNEAYERHNRTINTTEATYRLTKDEFKKYVDYLSPLNASLLNDVLDNYYSTYTAVINKNTDSTYTYKLSISGGLITYFDNIPAQIMPTVFDEDTAHKIEEYFNSARCTELVGHALDNLRLHSVNGVRANDHYRRYLTKDEFMPYACHIRFNSICRSEIDNILNHYENYIVYISREPTRGGSPYKLNVIDVATNELYYWDGFSNVALTNCFGEDVVRDARALDSIDNVSITPRELFAAHYMQRPTTLTIADDTPMSNTACDEEPVSDEIRTIDQLVVALDKLRQQRIAQLDALPTACASNMNRHEQYDYDEHAFNDNLLVNIDNLINSLNTVRRRSDM